MIQKENLISFQKISKTFGKSEVLSNLNLNIHKQEIIAVVGKSGCGKSTLFKIFLGFYKPDQGDIYYKKHNLVHNPKQIREIVGFVSQENSFYEKLSIQENLKFFAKLYKVSKSETTHRMDHLLELTNLTHAKKTIADKISGGMKRRLEFAISLIHNPEILILDEPFTGLDIKIRDELWEVIKQIKQSGVTIIVASHLLGSVQKHAERVVFLHNKQIFVDIDLKQKIQTNPNFDLEKYFKEVITRWWYSH